MLGMHWRETIHPEDHNLIEDKFEKVLSFGRAEAEIRGMRKNGFVFYKQLLMVKGLDSDTSTVHHYCFISDITEKLLDELTVLKSVKLSLESQEQRFYELIKDIPGIVFQSNVNEHWSFEYLSPGIEKLLGIPAYQLLKNGTKKYESFIHEEDLAYVKQVVTEAVATRQDYSVEYRIRTKENDIRWFRERATFSSEDASQNNWFGGIIRDISNDRQVEKRLNIAQTLINNANDIIIWLNEAGNIVYANDAASETLGYTNRELLSLSAFDIDPNFTPENRQQYLKTLDNFISRSLKFETLVNTKDRGELRVDVISSVIDIDNEKYTCVVARSIDFQKTLELSSHLFHSLSLKLLSSESQSEVLRELCVQVSEVIPNSIVSVLFPNDSGEDIDTNFSILSNDLPAYSTFNEISFPLADDSNITRVGLVEGFGIGHWRVPVLFPDRTHLGFLVVINNERELLRKDEIDLLEKVSTLVSLTSDTAVTRREILKYEKFFESGNDLMTYVDKDYRIEDVNRRYEKFHGFTRKQLIGRSFEEIVGKERFHEVIKSNLDRGLSGEHFELRDWVSTTQGVQGFFHIKIRPVSDGEKVLGILVVMSDITQLFNLSEALRESRNRYETVANNSADVMLITRLSDGKIITANSAFSEVTGYSVKEIIGQRAISLYSNPEDREKLLNELMTSGYCKNFRTGMKSKDGKEIPVILSSNLIEHQGEKCIFTITRDLSERVNSQIALRNKDKAIELLQQVTIATNEAKNRDTAFRNVLEMITDYCGWELAHIWLLNSNDESLYSSRIWSVNLSSPEEIAEFVNITEETLFENGLDLPEQVLKNRGTEWEGDYCGESSRARVQAAKKAGIVSGFGFPVYIEDKVVAVVELFSLEKLERDEVLLEDMIPVGMQLGRIIERSQTELALEQSRVNFVKAIDASPDSVVIIRLDDGKILNFNTAVSEATGYSREELENGNGMMFWVDEQACINHAKTIKKRGQVSNYSMLTLCKDGSTIPCLMSSTLIKIDGQKCSFSIVKDISELTLAHEEIRVNSSEHNYTESVLLKTNRALRVLSNSNRKLVTEKMKRNWSRLFAMLLSMKEDMSRPGLVLVIN